MSNNKTDSFELTGDTLENLVPQFIAYAVEGLIMLVVNLPITCAVLRFSTLRARKEYLLIAALAANDAINGFAYCTAGLSRWWLIVSDDANRAVSRWDCMTKPWVIGWVITEHSNGLLLIVISVDRIVAVFKPLVHYKLGRNYALALIAVAFAPAATGLPIIAAWNFFMTRHVNDVTAICFSEWVYTDPYYSLVYGQITVTFTAYSVLFLPIILKLNKKNTQNSGRMSQTAQQRAHVRQRKLSITLGISCLIAFVLSVIPSIILQFVYKYPLFSDDIKAYMIALSANLFTVSPVVNVGLLCSRHKDIRTAVIHLFLCKPLNHNTLSTVV